MEGLEERVLKLIVRHPKMTTALTALVSFALEGFDREKGGIIFAAGAGIYTGLTLAKDYWLGERETVEPGSGSLHHRIIAWFLNNPKPPAAAAGALMGTQSLIMHPGDLEKAVFSYAMGFLVAYWSIELNRRQEYVRRAEQRPKGRGLREKAKYYYNKALGKTYIPAAGVAGYFFFRHVSLEHPPRELFMHLSALCFVSGTYGLLTLLGGTILSGFLHTASLRKLGLLWQRRRCEKNEDVKKAAWIQKELLNLPMSSKSRIREMSRLARYYFMGNDYPKSLAVVTEMIPAAGEKSQASNPLDSIVEIFLPSVMERERMLKSLASPFTEEGIERALRLSMVGDSEGAEKAWDIIIRTSLKPEYMRILRALALSAAGEKGERGRIIQDVLARNREHFQTRLGSRYKVISFSPESEMNELITIKTGIEETPELRRDLKKEYAVSRYIGSCIHNRSPTPLALDESGQLHYIMSHVRGAGLGELIDTDRSILPRFVEELAFFQRITTEGKDRMERFGARVSRLSLADWVSINVVKRLGLEREGSEHLLMPLAVAEDYERDLSALFSNGDLHRDQAIKGENFCFLDFDRSCLVTPAFTLFGIYEDDRNRITSEEAGMLTKRYLDELNRDGKIVSAEEFDFAYDLIYGPRMLAAMAMFHEYSGKDPRFRESARSVFRKLRHFQAKDIAAQRFKDAALELVYSQPQLQQYITE